MKTRLFWILSSAWLVAAPVSAQSAAAAPTFNKEVAAILYENCITCHRPGEVAPMSLTDVRGSAAVGQGHQGEGASRRDAAMVCRPALREVQEQARPDAGADRHDRRVGRRRRAAGHGRRAAPGSPDFGRGLRSKVHGAASRTPSSTGRSRADDSRRRRLHRLRRLGRKHPFTEDKCDRGGGNPSAAIGR